MKYLEGLDTMKWLRFALILQLFLSTVGNAQHSEHVEHPDVHHERNTSDCFFCRDDYYEFNVNQSKPKPFHDFFCAGLVFILTPTFLKLDNRNSSRCIIYKYLLHLIQKYGVIEAVSVPTRLELWKSLRNISNRSDIVAPRKEISPILLKYSQLTGTEKCNSIYEIQGETESKPWKLPARNVDYSWVFNGIRDMHERQNTVLPLQTLDCYFKEVLDNASICQRMRHEWARYETFKTFPAESPAMPSRLAKTGFYFTGVGDEVTCFSCNVTHREWNDDDIPSDVHQTKSPSCRHVNGLDRSNVPIYANDDSYGIHSPQHEYHVQYSIEQDGAMGGNGAVQNNEHTRGNNQEQCCAVSSTRSAASYKYPNFADITYRMETLEKWVDFNKHDIKVIKETAESGFFFSDSGCQLRCFGCGMGVSEMGNQSTLSAAHDRMCPYMEQFPFTDALETTRQSQPTLDDQSKLTKGVPQAKFEESEIYAEERPSYNEETYTNITGHHNHQPTEQSGDSTRNESDCLSSRNKSDCLSTRNESDGLPGKRRLGDIAKLTATVEEIQGQLLQMGFDELRITHAVTSIGNKCGDVTCENVIEEILNGSNNHKETTVRRKSIKMNRLIPQDLPKTREECNTWRQQLTCKVCLDHEACMVIMPCGHLCTCVTCTLNVRKCPICRKMIRRVIRATI